MAAANAWKRLAVIALHAQESRVQLDEVTFTFVWTRHAIDVRMHVCARGVVSHSGRAWRNCWQRERVECAMAGRHDNSGRMQPGVAVAMPAKDAGGRRGQGVYRYRYITAYLGDADECEGDVFPAPQDVAKYYALVFAAAADGASHLESVPGHRFPPILLSSPNRCVRAHMHSRIPKL